VKNVYEIDVALCYSRKVQKAGDIRHENVILAIGALARFAQP
jgi:hypothetical protein